jgi:hypothetical protein
MTLRKPSILVVNWVSSCLSFFLRASTAATYIFTAPNCATTIIHLEPRALNAEFQYFVLSCSISYWDLIKCLYFRDTTERGDRGWKDAQRQGEDKVTLQITQICTINFSSFQNGRKKYITFMKNLVEFIRQSVIIAQARGSRALAVHTSHILNNVK